MIFALNVTQEAISYLVAAGIIFLIGIAIFVQYRQRKLRHLLFMCLCIITIAFFCLFNGLAVLLLSTPFILVRNYVLIPLALFIVVLLDSMTRDSTDPIKLAVTVGLSVALVIYNSDLTTVTSSPYPNGDPSLINVGFPSSIQVTKFALVSWIAFVAIFAFLRIYAHSPKPFRKYIILSLCGLICIGPVAILIALTIEWVVPGSIAIVQLGGSIAFTLGISLKSNLAFVLPFRALRLMVITTDSGIPLFTHTWGGDTRMVDDVLFSGMIQGVSGILKESVAEGEVEEIRLTNAVLIIQRSKDAKIACVLASTKTSKILRGALILFLRRFVETFAEELQKPNNISQFECATKIITQTFPFIPAYE